MLLGALCKRAYLGPRKLLKCRGHVVAPTVMCRESEFPPTRELNDSETSKSDLTKFYLK